MKPTPKPAPTPWVLQRLPHQKYVLHGSAVPLEVIEPRKAECQTGNPDNNLLAVYGTLLIHVAIAHAVIGRKRGHGRFAWKLRRNNAKFCILGRNVYFRTGYVHVLPVEEFEITRGGLFCVSLEPVRAVRIYKVEPRILTLLHDTELDVDAKFQ